MEQIRAWLLLWIVMGLVIVLVLAFFAATQTLLQSILRLAVPEQWHSISDLIFLVLLAAVCYRPVFGKIDYIYEILRVLTGVRTSRDLSLGLIPAIDALRSSAPIGLYLRPFGDEDRFSPMSRIKLPRQLGHLSIRFVSLENPGFRFRPDGFVVLSTPRSCWMHTVVSLMELSTVIVIDLNATFYPWWEEADLDIGFVRREAMSVERRGTVSEIEEILNRGYAPKTVVLTSESWLHTQADAASVLQQLAIEEALAYKRHAEILAARGTRATESERRAPELFPRTRLKRALLSFPRLVATEEEAVLHVKELLDTVR